MIDRIDLSSLGSVHTWLWCHAVWYDEARGKDLRVFSTGRTTAGAIDQISTNFQGTWAGSRVWGAQGKKKIIKTRDASISRVSSQSVSLEKTWYNGISNRGIRKVYFSVPERQGYWEEATGVAGWVSGFFCLLVFWRVVEGDDQVEMLRFQLS